MRRRLDLGASLTGRPPVMLLDEPTTGLDPRTRQELWSIVEELRRAGTTVLLTTQYLEEADRLAQRIAVVDHGRIVAEGTATELKATVGAEVLAVRVADPTRTADAAAALADLGAGDEPLVDDAAGEIRARRGRPRRLGRGGAAPRRARPRGRGHRAATAEPRRRVPTLTGTGRGRHDRDSPPPSALTLADTARRQPHHGGSASCAR